MDGIGTWLAAMMKTLTARVLTSLGFSVVSITGVTTALDQLQSMLVTWAQSIPAAAINLALLAGVGEGLGLILGAVGFRMMLWQISSTQRVLGVAPEA